jgi:Fe-S-cluster containining protein
MIEQYELYLTTIDKSLQKIFIQQEPYIFCKEGCSICCEIGEYPFTELEFLYAMVGYKALAEEKKLIIQEKVEKIKKDKEAFKPSDDDKKFMHECPFLIDKKCIIYKHRGIICRNYGLMHYTIDKDGKTFYQMPRCYEKGLNYSTVYDKETGTISSEKWKATGIETEPVSYNIEPGFLLNNNLTNELGLKFGESKALIDWF